MVFAVITTILLLFKIINAVIIPSTAQNITACGNLSCYHNGKCRTDGQGRQGCICESGYTGTTCEDDADECEMGHPCMHRGHCHNTIGSFRCECLEGWSGDKIHCENKENFTDVHKCMPGWMGEMCQDQCLNDSMCQPNEVCTKRGRGLGCRCAPGWHGVNCTDIDECAGNPCSNTNYTCMNTPGSFDCQCLSGWKGDKCDEDIDECLINPCQHSSTCTNEQGYYNCRCALGWKGGDCSEDIDECASDPCAYGKNKICANTIGSFECTCESGWKGANCTEDINECMMPVNITENSCKHSGLCTNTIGSYICNCTSGWQGDYCDVDIDECANNPCNVTLTCENNPGSYSCSGKQMSSKGTSDSRNTYIIVGAVLSSLLVVISIVACIAIMKCKGKAKRVVNEECQEQQQQQQQQQQKKQPQQQ